MSKWPLVNLPDICRPKQWPTIPKTKMLSSGFPVYGANGRIGYFSEYNHEEPTILITCRGATCGTINVCEPKSYVTGNAMALDDLDASRVNLRFITRALEGTDFSSVITGVAQPQITRQTLSRLQVPLPPLSEQKRIAGILDAADAVRAKRREALSQLDTLLQSTFIKMFGDPVTNPMGWECYRVADVTTVGSGAGFPNEFQGEADEEYPFYKVSDMNLQGNETHMRYHNNAISGLVRAKLGAKTHPAGTIIFPKIGAAIATNKKRILTTESCFDNNVMGIHPSERIFGEYLFHLLLTKDLMDFANPGNPPSIRKTALENWVFPLPLFDFQCRFAAIVQSIERQKARMRAHLAELDALFASLQSRAFSGTL